VVSVVSVSGVHGHESERKGRGKADDESSNPIPRAVGRNWRDEGMDGREGRKGACGTHCRHLYVNVSASNADVHHE